MVLPPGVSASSFDAAIKAFAAVVGRPWVFTSPDDVALYRDAYSILWGEPEERVASAAVAPASVEEVQAVVRIANKYKIAIYPISTGRNLTYGGSSPTLSGSVVLDLKRMNKIIRVDDKRHFCLVEPGVSYFDLYRYIQENKLKVWIDVPDPGWGSLMGNALDHGLGGTMGPFRDHWGSHCGLEVVTADGGLMRTGMGALPNADSWQEHKYGVGPHVDGLFAQSNFGVVTKMGFWLMPEQEAFLTGTIMVPRHQDIIPLVEVVNYLENSSLIGMPGFQSPAGGGGAQGPSREGAALMKDGWPSQAQIDAFVAKSGRPAWAVNLRFYGPEETVKANWAYARKRALEAIPNASFRDGELVKLPMTPEQLDRFQGKGALGVPTLSVFNMMSRRDDNPDDPPEGHADFLAVIPRTGQAILDSARLVAETYMELGMAPQTSPFSGPQTWIQRSFLMSAIVFTYKDVERNKKGRALFSRLIDKFAERGWGEYRTSPAFQEQLVSKYAFNDHALLRFQEKLKDAVDPNGIISPGRYGVWPKRLRRSRA